MRCGVACFVTDEGIGPAELGAQLEQRGFASLFLAEHSHIPVNTRTPFYSGGPIPRQFHRSLDPFVALAAAASATTTLALGTGVALIPNRDPITTAKEVASLDLLSQGRFHLGVGVGWLREEIADHGVDPAVRGRVADERLAAMIAIWTQERAEFHGQFVDFDPIYCWPKPVQQPHPPLYVGGGPANFDRIARLKAGWIPMSTSADLMSEQLTELRTVVGHDVPVIGLHMGDHTPADVGKYRQLDMEQLLVELPTEPRDQTLRRLDALQPLIAELA